MVGVLLLLLLAITTASVLARGLRRRSWRALRVGLGGATTSLVVFGLFSAWGAMLWFDDLGPLERFWAALGATVALSLVAASAAALLLAIVTLPSSRAADRAARLGVTVAALTGAAWGLASWPLVLRWWPSLPERTFGSDAVRHLPALAFADALFSLLLLVAILCAAAAAPSAHRRRVADARRRGVDATSLQRADASSRR